MLGTILGAAASIGSSLLGKNSAEKAAKQNYQQQKEFAQSGIQWKVADAKKAGIHPLYALGANTVSFSPTAMGTDFGGIAQAGQDIGRAIDATRSPSGKLDAVSKTVADLQLTRMGLENELLASQIAKVRQGSPSPGIPGPDQRYLLDGQGQTALWSEPLTEEFKRSPGMPGNTSAEYGSVSDVGYVRTPQGGYAVVPSQDAKNRIEDQLLPEFGWAVRNLAAPALFDRYYNPPPPQMHRLNDDEVWQFNPYTQEYYPVKKGRHVRFSNIGRR